MSLEEEIKKFKKNKEKLEPVALHCSFCGVWSAYSIENNNQMPHGWHEDKLQGHLCNKCGHKKRKNYV